MSKKFNWPSESELAFYKTNKPLTRWWWFSGQIDEAVIRHQLDWVKSTGFGGVEIAWVYPLPGQKPGPRFLDDDWADRVACTKRYADELGLICDFSFGTLWPFGGSFVDETDASRVFGGISSQRLEYSWDAPFEEKPGYILDHLNSEALTHYAENVGAALSDALRGGASALFCDSWEVETQDLWADGFAELFEEVFGYDVQPFMDAIHDHPDIRYDYRKLISRLVLDEFYRPFTEIAHRLNAYARVQCHGAPTDLLAAYAAVDIPESEAILFDADFSVIAASAAVMAEKQLVTSEAFTCLYGWEPRPGPGPYHKQEQIADLKLLADALFANGVNHIIWHGMPYNPPEGQNEFYATVHVGPDAHFAEELPVFNAYMERVSRVMKAGKTYTSIAVYLPLEDAWMLNKLPSEQSKPSANYHWEMQTVHPPHELKGYQPLWISNTFLQQAHGREGKMLVGGATFRGLFIDVDWLATESLVEVLKLARHGLPVCIRKPFRQPGKSKSPDYRKLYAELINLENVGTDPREVFDLIRPLVEGDHLPDFWCRVYQGDYYLFFAHPKAQGLHYPMRYGESYIAETVRIPITINLGTFKVDYELVFEPYQSVLIQVAPEGEIEVLDIQFSPSVPQKEQSC